MNQELRQALYMLKDRWGEPVTLTRITANTPDPQTGRVTQTKEIYQIPKAVLVGGPGKRDFVYHRSFIAASRAFIYGGTFDDQSGFLIVDVTDLPTGYVPRQEDYVAAGGQRLQIKTWELQGEVALVINYSVLSDQPVERVYDEVVKDYMNLQEEAQSE